MNTQAVLKFSPLTIALSSIFFAQQLHANQTQDVEVVEVFGHQQNPANIIIDSEQLDNIQAQDLNDIFRQDAEVTVGGSSGISQKIYVRGLEDTMLNISIDGAEQSGNLFHHQGRLAIEPELLKQVDVVAGTGRATDGPGALGGAIRFTTKDAADLLRGNERFGTLIKGGYYSNTKGYKVSASAYGEVYNQLGLLLSLGYVDGDDIRDGNGDTQPYTALEQQIALLKLSGDLNDSHYFALSVEYRNDDGERLNRPQYIPSFKNEPLEQETDRQTITFNHRYNANEWLNIHTTLYNTRSRIAHKDHPRWGTSDGNIETFGGKLFGEFALAEHSLTIGSDFKRDESSFETNYDGKQHHSEKGRVIGLFVQDDWQMSEKWLLSLGARYDWYDLTDNIDQDFSADGFSPNATLVYQLSERLSLQASYAEAFRGQQIKELFVIDYRKNDPNRKAERAKTAEIGAYYEQSNLFAGITLFDSVIEDVVTNQGTYTNVGDLDNRGFTVFSGVQYEALTGRLSYNQSRPELNGKPLGDEDYTLGTSVGNTWALNLDYQWNDAINFGWNARFVERLTDTADAEFLPEKPGYGVHDLYAAWWPLTDDSLKTTLSIKNLFDKQYYDHASYVSYVGSPVAQGYANPGRDIRLSVSYQF